MYLGMKDNVAIVAVSSKGVGKAMALKTTTNSEINEPLWNKMTHIYN